MGASLGMPKYSYMNTLFVHGYGYFLIFRYAVIAKKDIESWIGLNVEENLGWLKPEELEASESMQNLPGLWRARWVKGQKWNP